MTRIHIFKPGRHTDSGGSTLEFSEESLRAAAAAYDPALHEAPLVAGHPKHDLPAYGWVERLEVDEDGLHAIPTQVDAEFAEIVEAGRYKHISASFYLPEAPANPVPGTLYLRHVGFLGAQPPAVKGLRHIEFNEAEAGVASFDEALPIGPIARLFRGMRDWFISREGVEVADRVVPQWDVEEIEGASRRQAEAGMARAGMRFDEGAAPEIEAPEVSAPDAPAGDAPAPDDDVLDVDPPPAPDADEATTRLEEIERREADLATREQAVATAEAQRLADEEAAARRRATEEASAAMLRPATEFAERLGRAGQLLPREELAIAETLAALAATEATVQFGEGDDAEAVRADAVLRDVLARLPKSVDYGERGAPQAEDAGGRTLDFVSAPGTQVSQDRLRLHQQAIQYSEQHGVSYVEAARTLGA